MTQLLLQTPLTKLMGPCGLPSPDTRTLTLQVSLPGTCRLVHTGQFLSSTVPRVLPELSSVPVYLHPTLEGLGLHRLIKILYIVGIQ